MKNHIYKIFSLSVIAFSFVACDLDEYPEDSISPDTYFKNEKELKLYSNQFYTQLPDASDCYQEMSDLVCNGLAYNDAVRGYSRVVPGTGGGWSFTALRHINYMLSNLYRCQDEKVRKHYEGVGRFFRAYFYFSKLQRFGEVPFYDKVLNSDDQEMLCKPRDSRDFIIAKINADLDTAALYLPEFEESNRIVNKYTALALKARANLYEGTFRKYHNGRPELKGETLEYQSLLQKTVDAAQAIMASNRYALYTDGDKPYYNLFCKNDPSGKEYILNRSYAVTTHDASNYALVSSKGAAGATRTLALSYLKTDGSRFTDVSGYETKYAKDEYNNRDPRMAQTILTKSFKYADGTTASFNKGVTLTGYPIVKYVEGETAKVGSHVDIPVFRYAEVLLNYAEALAELGTITQDHLDKSINVVRDRVNMPHLNLAKANANPDPFLCGAQYGYKNVDNGANKGVILEIRRERTIELVMEGFRYQDLVRWREIMRFDNQDAEGNLNGFEFYGPYVKGAGRYDMDCDGNLDFVVNQEGGRPISPVAGVTSVTIGKDIILSDGNKGFIIALGDMKRVHNEDRDYLFPLPLTELTLSKGALTQNPNWDDISR